MKLRTFPESLDSRLNNAWPRDTRKEPAIYNKLKDAYVKARHSKHYTIADEELDWLVARIETLHALIEVCYEERLWELERGVSLNR